MKNRLNQAIEWFEEKFDFIIDTVAVLGGLFLIVLAIAVFISLLLDSEAILNSLENILLPGFIGFLGVMVLFAVRITRHLTK